MHRALRVVPLALLLASAFSTAQQQPVFRGGVEVVAIDVRVLDGKGRPVADLRSDEFSVAVDGISRRIATAEFVAVASATASRQAPQPSRELRPLFTSNLSPVKPAAARVVVIVVDQENIGPGRGLSAVQKAAQFVDWLGPNDRVGLAVIPQNGLAVDPTTDHDAVKRALGLVVGRGTSNDSATLRYNIALSEAFAFGARDRDTWKKVIERECYNRQTKATVGGRVVEVEPVSVCEGEVTSIATNMVTEARRRVLASLRGQRALLTALGQIAGPKDVVLISEELVVPPYLSERAELEAEMREIGKAAARSQVSTHVLQLDTSPFDASTAGVPQSVVADADMRAAGLQEVAGVTGGSWVLVVGSARGAFERLALETSGYYLLGVATEAPDRDGKSHRIEVRVTRRDVSVRARREFSYVVQPATAIIPPLDPTNAVQELLRRGLPSGEVPLSVATYAVRDVDPSRVRVLITAEIDRGVKAPRQTTVGFVLVDEQGNVKGSSVERVTLSPVPDARSGVLAYVAASIVEPGRYRLCLAAADEAGRRGSVAHDVEARLTVAEQVTVGDLLIFDPHPSADGKQRPTVSAALNDSVKVFFELYPETPAAADAFDARLEVAATADAPALVSEAIAVGETETPGRLLASGVASLAGLEPGVYVARAAVSLNGRHLARIVRPIRIERSE